MLSSIAHHANRSNLILPKSGQNLVNLLFISEPSVLRAVPPEHGRQGEEHVHLHRVHPRRHEAHPGDHRGAGCILII